MGAASQVGAPDAQRPVADWRTDPDHFILADPAIVPDFAPPADDDVKSYWSRSSFFRYAEELYTMRGTVPKGRAHQDSDTVLEVTPMA